MGSGDELRLRVIPVRHRRRRAHEFAWRAGCRRRCDDGLAAARSIGAAREKTDAATTMVAASEYPGETSTARLWPSTGLLRCPVSADHPEEEHDQRDGTHDERDPQEPAQGGVESAEDRE